MSDLFDRRGVTLAEQLAAANREVGFRARVYPRLVAAGKMTSAKAEAEQRAMAAIVATLEWLLARER